MLRRMMLLICVVLCWMTSARGDARTDLVQKIGIDQHIGTQLPADLVFQDESGRAVRLGDYFHGNRPIILNLVYFKCPMLCSTVLNEMVICLNVMPMNMSKDYDVLTISFSPEDTAELAAAKRHNYVSQYKHPSDGERGWHFLVGGQSQIDEVTKAVGFRYVPDPSIDEAHPHDKQFIHPSGIMVLTPDGRISKYFYGIDYRQLDLRLALLDAGEGKEGTPRSLADSILLACFHYDPSSGKYTPAVLRILKVGGGLTLAIMAFFWFRLTHPHRRDDEAPSAGPT